MSLRARLLITSVVLVAAGLLAANVGTYRYLSHFLLQRVDDQLTRTKQLAADELSVQGGFDGRHGGPGGMLFPAGTYAELLNPSGKFVDGKLLSGFPGDTPPQLSLPKGLPGSDSAPQATPRSFTTHAVGGSPSGYRALAVGVVGGGTLVLASPLSDVAGTLHQLVILEIVVSAIVLLAVAGLAMWLVRVGLRPLEGIGETAGAIAAGDLSRRVEPAEERTEIGRLGLALNSMLAQIEAAFEERRASESRLRRFVADASHELRTPLTSIRGYAELFRRGADSRPQDLAKTMRAIEAEASRMGILVDDLLLLARLDQGRPLEREHVDLGRVAGDAVESARAIEPDRPISLDVDHGPAFVDGDRGRLRQVLDNLLDNVRVHTAAGTPVHVKVGTEHDEVLLSVADEGPGLSPDIASRVFERFYRGDPTRSRRTGGAGLGLSIVSAIVEAHGGSVACSSPEGAGATFEVRLPLRAEERPGSDGTEREGAESPGSVSDLDGQAVPAVSAANEETA